MYYKAGEIKNKIINFNGFEFKVSAMKRHDGISIQVKDMNNVPLKSFHVVDFKRTIYCNGCNARRYKRMDWREHRWTGQTN